LVAAFSPVLWLIAAAGLCVGVGFMALSSGRGSLNWRRLVTIVVVLIVPLVVLVPWTSQVFSQPRLLLLGSGLPEFYTAHRAPSGLALTLLRAGGPAQPPIWIGIPVLAAALLGLTRRSRVAIARTGALLLVGGIALAIWITRTAGVSATVPASRHWPGIALLVAGAGALAAALVAATGARPALRNQSFGWRQPAAIVLVLLSVAATVALGGGWLVRGAGGPLTGRNPQVLPLFVSSELALKPTGPRALVLDSTGPVISYSLVRRGSGPQLGDADTAPTGKPSAAAVHLQSAVRDLVAGRAGAGAELAPFDIEYVVAPGRSASRVQSALGRAATLTVVPAPGATVWRSSLPTGELTVLDASAASTALAGGVPSSSGVHVLGASAGSVDSILPPGSDGRLAVLAEPASPHWHASLDGKPLVGRTAYGWAQAFEVPASSGILRVGYANGPRHRWLWVELAAVVVVLLATIPARRPDDFEAEAEALPQVQPAGAA
jgi:hypothetical protein